MLSTTRYRPLWKIQLLVKNPGQVSIESIRYAAEGKKNLGFLPIYYSFELRSEDLTILFMKDNAKGCCSICISVRLFIEKEPTFWIVIV